MKFRRLCCVTLVAAALHFSAERLYSVPVVTTQQTTSKKPARFYYVCPMHPDVQRKRPGKCPKCKMNLEKKQVQPAIALDK